MALPHGPGLHYSQVPDGGCPRAETPGAFRREGADGEQRPPELREEPARRPNAAVNKEAAGTALCCSACGSLRGIGARGRLARWESQDQGWRRGMEGGSAPLGARFCLLLPGKGEKPFPEECW